MKNIAICFLSIGLTFVGVDGAWAAEEKEYEERNSAYSEKYRDALEEAEIRAARAAVGQGDPRTDNVFIITEEHGFVSVQGLPGGETKPNE